MNKCVFKTFKKQLDINEVATRLGLELLDERSNHTEAWPCPENHDSQSKTCFHLLPQYNAYKCHNCGTSGDVLNLISHVLTGERANIKEAIAWVCQEFELPSPLKGISDKELDNLINLRKEQEWLQKILRAACAYWHNNTPPEIFDALESKYGIKKETSQRLQLGYTNGKGLKKHLIDECGFSIVCLNKSGLFCGESLQYEFFKKRIIFPYWENNEVVYLIARKVDPQFDVPLKLLTKMDEYEESKYKKMRLQSKKNPHVSVAVHNNHVFQAGTTEGKELIITEGITDCIAAFQADFPCIASATTQFKKSLMPQIEAIARRYERVFICNDNEENDAGKNGAWKTAEGLAEKGINAYLVTLPRPNDLDKIDLCDFLRNNDPSVLKALMDKAPSAIEAKTQQIADSSGCKIKPEELKTVLNWISALDDREKESQLEKVIQLTGLTRKSIDAAVRSAEKERKSADKRKRLEKAAGSENNWLEKIIWKDGDKYVSPANNRHNALLIFRHDQRLKGVFAYDQLLEAVVWLKQPPFDTDYRLKVARGTPVSDADEIRLQAWLEKEWSLFLSTEAVARTFSAVAETHSFHPIKEWLETLVWDCHSRLEMWMVDNLRAEDTEYTRLVSKKSLIAAVARVYEPGCKVDNVPVLEGIQGTGKSSALRILCGTDYFSDTPLDMRSKDRFIALRGKWFIEWAEMDVALRHDPSTLKAYITAPSDSFRPPYAKRNKDYPRQCLFWGTVNHGDYLRDETGGRRYWPVKCGKADLEKLKKEREQIWAEAVQLYKQGERWWVEGDEKPLFEPEQESRLQEDAWEGIIRGYLEVRDTVTIYPQAEQPDDFNEASLLGEERGEFEDSSYSPEPYELELPSRDRVAIMEILHSVLEISPGRLTNQNAARVGRILKSMGWEKEQKRGLYEFTISKKIYDEGKGEWVTEEIPTKAQTRFYRRPNSDT
jgi:predicted P-loop ATPase